MKTFFKMLLGSLVYTVTILTVLAALAFGWAARDFSSPGPLTQTMAIMVPRGEGIEEIANLLQEKQIIENAVLFKYMGVLTQQHKLLKAGEYEFPPRITMKQVLAKLVKGDVISRNFTIPEGRTSYEVVEILKAIEGLEGNISTIPAEGSLLPETYDYRRGETREQMLERMRQSMDKVLEELWPGRAENLPFKTAEEALILASIVEKETSKPEERARIAGVFVNRLRTGIPLQTDPTVIYALTNGRPQNKGQGPLGRRLLTKDLKFESPYNTYLHAGLPPGPIANPGRAAIEATLNPEQHDFIYFVADGTGGHVFSATGNEHSKNVAAWRKIRKEQAD